MALKSVHSKALLSIVFLCTVMLLAFQNCSDVSFSSGTPSSVVQDLDNSGPGVTPPPVVPPPGPITCNPFVMVAGQTCPTVGGLVGELYYFLNKSTESAQPSVMYDKDDVAIAFPGGINSVEMFFTRGYKLDTQLVMSQIYVPTIKYTQGFSTTEGQPVLDIMGKKLIEAFAFRVAGNLRLKSDMAPGLYEIATLSDDGSRVEEDGDGDGAYSVLVDNDGNHSTAFRCSRRAIELTATNHIPIIVKYYQGPRTEIAMTLLMRALQPGQAAGQDPDCSRSSSRTEWFNGDVNTAGYVPDPVNGRFGELIERGWFVPTAEMFK